MPDWTDALVAFVRATAPVDLTWMVVGSAATALHGVDGIVPGDVDILVHPATADQVLNHVADRLAATLPDGTAGAAPTEAGDDLARFVSSASRPILHSGTWALGRWHVQGHKLEVARIREDHGRGPVETQGLAVWDYRETIAWRGAAVPVVPLEVQWATVILRGQADRQAAIARTPGLPWNASLARAALRARDLDPSQELDGPRTTA